jgi:UDP-glucose 4-epimerase
MTKKVIVTGGCGFIGSEVVSQLVARGYEVRVLDDLSKPESKVAEDYEFIQYDLTVPDKLNELFRGFDLCVNMAAKIGGIGYFHKYPATILSENNKIYSNTFEAAARVGIERMLYVSSSMVFESTDRFPSKESDVAEIPVPISSYGFSKLVGEQYCRAFLEEYDLPYTICRPFNAFGVNEAPGEDVGYAHVIPDLTKKILMGQNPLELLGDGRQTRCYTHVSDIADGIITALGSPAGVNEDFNISSPREIAVNDLATKIYKHITGNDDLEVKYVPGFEHDIRRRIPDTAKAERVLGWKAKYELDDKLPEVVDWIRANFVEVTK